MSVNSAIGLFSSADIPIPYPSPTITTQVGNIPTWNVVANTTQNNEIVNDAPIGFYTITWQGTLGINLTGASASSLSCGVYQGNPLALFPVKFPTTNLTNIDANSTETFYYTGGSVSFYNPVVQDIGFFRSASSDFLNGATPAQWTITSFTLVKQNYEL
jgi:hypothetical protein